MKLKCNKKVATKYQHSTIYAHHGWLANNPATNPKHLCPILVMLSNTGGAYQTSCDIGEPQPHEWVMQRQNTISGCIHHVCNVYTSYQCMGQYNSINMVMIQDVGFELRLKAPIHLQQLSDK
ncbi:hypothetical protein GDO78_009409 [Eleutherodactylus coqui]|uniref:Uncharacterized protein n=1 Tax=Eleutherodactylus coqui TaxID=57060 RepID=A0A8J6FAH0_ELECQ|nr:hypothetical protein GDO78_009409 [Eleutherodactylus coqui]